MSANGILKSVGVFVDKHSPEILFGAGISGMLTTVALSVKATPKAMKSIDETKRRKQKTKLTAWETIAATWKHYIPATLTGLASVACLIGSDTANHKRNAALATAYALSESALKSYADKVIETIGEKKEKQIRDKVSEGIIADHPVSKSEVLIATKGNTLCFDTVSGRYFKSDMDRIQKAANEINRKLRDEMYIPLNDFYSELGLPNIEAGELLGWNIDRGYLDVRFDTQLADDGTPALVVNYQVIPKYGYR